MRHHLLVIFLDNDLFLKKKKIEWIVIGEVPEPLVMLLQMMKYTREVSNKNLEKIVRSKSDLSNLERNETNVINFPERRKTTIQPFGKDGYCLFKGKFFLSYFI